MRVQKGATLGLLCYEILNFYRKKHRCFKLTTTLTYLTIWIKKLKNKRCKYWSNNYLYLDHVQVFITLCVFPWLILKPHTCPILSPIYLEFQTFVSNTSRNKGQKSCQCQPVHCLWKGPYFKDLGGTENGNCKILIKILRPLFTNTRGICIEKWS